MIVVLKFNGDLNSDDFPSFETFLAGLKAKIGFGKDNLLFLSKQYWQQLILIIRIYLAIIASRGGTVQVLTISFSRAHSSIVAEPTAQVSQFM